MLSDRVAPGSQRRIGAALEERALAYAREPHARRTARVSRQCAKVLLAQAQARVQAEQVPHPRGRPLAFARRIEAALAVESERERALRCRSGASKRARVLRCGPSVKQGPCAPV